jgi:hypothetical protein
MFDRTPARPVHHAARQCLALALFSLASVSCEAGDGESDDAELEDSLDEVDDPAQIDIPPPAGAGKADGASWVPMYGAGNRVHIRFAGFIPCQVLGPGPLGEGIGNFADFFLAGDGRGFSFTAARDRSRAAVSSLVSKTRIESTHEHVGASQAYRDDVLRTDGGAWSQFARCFSVVDGGTPYFEHSDPVPQVDTWHATQDKNADWTLTKTTFRIQATGQTPVGSFPCSLDGIGDLYIWWDNAGTARYFDVRVSHDAFPAYELYINETAVFTHDPRSTGHSPLDLCLPQTRVGKQATGSIG